MDLVLVCVFVLWIVIQLAVPISTNIALSVKQNELMYVCMYMYIYFVNHEKKKTKQLSCLELNQENRKKNSSKKEQPMHCIAPQSIRPQTKMTRSTAQQHCLQLVRAPSLNQLTVSKSLIKGQPTNRCSFSLCRNPSSSATVLIVFGCLFYIDEHWYSILL